MNRYNIVPFIVGMFLGCLIALASVFTSIRKTKLVPCPVINERTVILKHEKYEMFIDSMEKAKKKDVERLTDSLNKYRAK